MLQRLSLLTIQLTSDPVRVRLAVFGILLTLALFTVLIPGTTLLADGMPGGPLPPP